MGWIGDQNGLVDNELRRRAHLEDDRHEVALILEWTGRRCGIAITASMLMASPVFRIHLGPATAEDLGLEAGALPRPPPLSLLQRQ